MKNRIHLFLLILLVALSFLTRFINLETLPDAFFTDEAALGYNGWSIMTTGRDEYGKFFPLTLRSFDDYKPAVYSYLVIPFIFFGELNQFSSRAPAALFGSLLPVLIYWLVIRINGDKKLALLSGFVVLLTPWHIEISRTAIEAGVALTLTIIAFSLMTYDKKKHFVFALIVLILTLFTYHTARLISPLLIILAMAFGVISSSKSRLIIMFLIMILGVSLSLFSSSSRFSQISIFNDVESKLLREEAIREDGGPIPVSLFETRMYHNKVLSIIQTFAKSYITNTSFSYLFLGGAQPPRVTIPETGQFLLIFFPFFLLGIFSMIRNYSKFNKLILIWLILSPIPASLTTAEIPHTYRTLFMLPAIAIIIGSGLHFTISAISSSRIVNKHLMFKTSFLVFLCSAIIFNFFKAWHQYAVHQQVHQPWYRQYGYKELISYLNTLDDAESITITNRENEPYMMILFYNQIEPRLYQQQPQKRLGHNEISAGEKQWQLFNYVFTEDACPHDLNDNNPNNYYVSIFTCELPDGFERLKVVNFLDGNPEFYVDRPMYVE